MTTLTDTAARTDILKRLRRAEGQLRGIQRMVEEGKSCQEVAQQFSAVRKALEATYVRMTMCLLEQELAARTQGRAGASASIAPLLADMQKLLTRGA